MNRQRQDEPASRNRTDLRQATLAELRELGRQRGMSGVSRMTKAKLVDELMGQSAVYLPARPLLTMSGIEDRFDVEAINPRWLRARWGLTERTLERALAAMGADRHRARAVLRLQRVLHDETGPRSIEHVADFPIPGDASEWFVNTPRPGESWKLELGLLARENRFFCLARSVRVQLPAPRGPLPAAAEDERDELRCANESVTAMRLDLQGELLIHGKTAPDANVTFDEEAIAVHEQTGEFQARIPLSQGRLVVAVESAHRTGRRRALLAVETHIRHLDPDPYGTAE
jgi:hypothetical protein